MSTTTVTVTEPAAHAAIIADCKALDLPGIQEVAEPLADAVARQHHTHARYVAEFLTCECEQHDDRRRARRVKEARFPRPKCLKDFVVAQLSDLPATLAHLADGTWIDNGEPLVLLGDSGTGKTH